MPVRRIFLGFPESSDVVIGGSAFGAFGVFTVDFVETTLVKRMFTQEVDSGQVKIPAARRASPCLENGGLVT